jgi:anti-sigma regulatory factor (Ser/Thr protein kinase)
MEERVIALRPGERAIFGSDGIFEMASPEGVLFQDVAAELLDSLASKTLGEMVGTFCTLSCAHGHGNVTDDLLAVAIEQPPVAPPPYGFRIHLPSSFAAIDTACEHLVTFLHSQSEFAALAEEGEFSLLLAAREALSNAVIHGNREEPGRTICFACSTEPPFRKLTMTITDEGNGFDFAQYSAPEDLQTSERGRGVPILRATTRSMRMTGGELQFEFDLDAQPEEGSDGK